MLSSKNVTHLHRIEVQVYQKLKNLLKINLNGASADLIQIWSRVPVLCTDSPSRSRNRQAVCTTTQFHVLSRLFPADEDLVPCS